MGVLLGLLAALGWGSADFLARYATRLIGTYRTLFYMQFIGLSSLSVYLLATGQLPRLLETAGWRPWAWCVVVALLNVVGSLALYRAFEIGVLMIVSPIAASYAALTVTLSLLSGETLSRLRGLGIGLALIGAVFAATSFAPPQEVKADIGEQRRKQRLTRGAGLAVFAAVAYGVMFWLLGFQVTPALGGVAPIWLIRLVTPCTLALLATPTGQSLRLRRQALAETGFPHSPPVRGASCSRWSLGPLARLRLPSGRGWWLIAGVGVLDTSAYVANTIGFTTHQIAVVSVLASLFSTVTVMLAWFFLRERLHWSQWLGVAGIFAGVALVSV